MNKVCVVGLGYIGLPTAFLLAKAGVEVVGFDVDEKKVKTLNNGELYFEEDGLPELFAVAKAGGNFGVTNEMPTAGCYIVAVPTPVSDGKADLAYVFRALNLIEPKIQDGATIIIESTIGPRDCVDEIMPHIDKWGKKLHFAHCTERAIPGNTLYEMVNNDRIVGGKDDESSELVKTLYQKFCKGNIYTTDPTTAASCKVMENTYRAVNIALANEFARLAKENGFNVWEAIELTNLHPRVNVHQPGPGVGGHCISIDPYFFSNAENKSEFIEMAMHINEAMPQYVYDEVLRLCGDIGIEAPVVGILGYAYKKDVDDLRETPAEFIIEKFKDYEVLVNDDYVKQENFVAFEELLKKVSVAILVTDHSYYKDIDFTKYPNIKLVYDTRNLFSEEKNKLAEGVLKKIGV